MLEYGSKVILENVNLEIPSELIKGTSHEINYSLIKNKTIIGLCGYAGSGKDIIGSALEKRLNFKRVSFAMAIKKIMDEHMTQQVYEDLKKRGFEINLEDINQANPKNRDIKELIRPYLIWFGETVKQLNGQHYWTNRALEEVKDSKKIVITDVRRVNEIELFDGGTEHYKKSDNNLKEVGLTPKFSFLTNPRGYESLLLNINQRNLVDKDKLTHDTINMAFEKWLFDEIIYVDSELPSDNNEIFRKKHIMNHIVRLTQKYPQYFI